VADLPDSLRGTLAKAVDVQVGPSEPVQGHVGSYSGPAPLDADFHGAFEVVIPLQGRYRHVCEGWETTVERGDVVLTPGWEWHGWECAGAVEMLVVHFLPEFLGDETFDGLSWRSLFAAPPQERPRVTTAETREHMLAIGEELGREVEEKPPAWRVGARLGLLLVLLTLSRGWRPPAKTRARAQSAAANLTRVMPAVGLATSNPDRRVSVEEAASACAMSVSQFCFIFRQTMGLSFGAFARRARLARATELLRHTDLSVEAIAAATGFVDGSHIHRVFRGEYACTPGEYRVRSRGRRQTRR
jgi:AraC-like DNA-binding protein